MYDLLPPEYQSFKDKFDSADLRGKKINDFFEKKVIEQKFNFFEEEFCPFSLKQNLSPAFWCHPPNILRTLV